MPSRSRMAVALAVAMAGGAARAGVVRDRGLNEDEARVCKPEVTAVDTRLALLARPGASPTGHHAQELRREEAALAACLDRVRKVASHASEEVEIRAEAARRIPAHLDTAEYRERVEQQVRIERARAKPADRRLDTERKLVAEADAADRERAWAEDAGVRRVALSASICASLREIDAARAEIAAIDAGAGERTRRYMLVTRSRRATENADARRDELEGIGGAVACADTLVDALTSCLAAGEPPPAACGAPELKAYLRIIQ